MNTQPIRARCEISSLTNHEAPPALHENYSYAYQSTPTRWESPSLAPSVVLLICEKNKAGIYLMNNNNERSQTI